MMKMVYIASPFRGAYEEHIKQAIEYCKIATTQGVLPLAPHLIFSQWCNDTIPMEREQGLSLGLALLSHCDELWVMGERISEGMRGEIEYAKEYGIPTHHIEDPTYLPSYPISCSEESLLGSFDVLEHGGKDNYEGKVVVLKPQELKAEYKTPQNQLWIATHGPGCRTGGISDTVHLRHIVDGDCLVVGRADLLGIAKDEVVEALYQRERKKEESDCLEEEDRMV